MPSRVLVSPKKKKKDGKSRIKFEQREREKVSRTKLQRDAQRFAERGFSDNNVLMGFIFCQSGIFVFYLNTRHAPRNSLIFFSFSRKLCILKPEIKIRPANDLRTRFPRIFYCIGSSIAHALFRRIQSFQQVRYAGKTRLQQTLLGCLSGLFIRHEQKQST